MGFIDDNELRKTINRLEFYSKEEKNVIETLRDIYDGLNVSYSTTNKDRLINKGNELLSKANIFYNTHCDYINVFNKNIEKYLSIAQKVETKFKDLG